MKREIDEAQRKQRDELAFFVYENADLIAIDSNALLSDALGGDARNRLEGRRD